MNLSRAMSWLFGLLLCGPAAGLPPMQLYVALTPEGGELRLPPGEYAGPVVIERRIIIDGGGKVTINAEGDGSVLTLKANAKGSVIRGLRITGSGHSHDRLDAGVMLEADQTLIENNQLDDVLFGIHLRNANDNILRGNRISSKPDTPSLRGEAIRLWYSHDNLIEDNDIDRARDITVNNSSGNRFTGNRIRNSRVGMELVFSPENEIVGNSIANNGTGLLILYSDDLLIERNTISHLRSFSGAALAFKESSGVVVRDNQIIHCAVGVTANAPLHPENVLQLQNNHFAYNDVALYFYGEKGGHIVHGNRFLQNLSDVRISAPSAALHNDWRGNHWDLYQGFDLDQNGVGDTPYRVHLYSDRLWMDRPMSQFFRGSPLLEALDFMERLAPFSPPQRVLTDGQPMMD
jgi:nitrous oxidase accessory protein